MVYVLKTKYLGPHTGTAKTIYDSEWEHLSGMQLQGKDHNLCLQDLTFHLQLCSKFSRLALVDSISLAISDTCRMMGNRTFMDLMSVDEIHGRSRDIIEPQDVICVRDYMQYSSHLDELPACLGGRENGWRFLSLKVLSRNSRDDVKSGMKRPVVRNLKKGRSWGHSHFSEQQLSQRGLSSRCSTRAKITAARMRRLYVMGDAERVSEEESNMDNIKTDNQKSTAEKYEIRIILPSVQTEDYGDRSSESEWEEEAEELCNWSKQLNTDDVDAPEFV